MAEWPLWLAVIVTLLGGVGAVALADLVVRRFTQPRADDAGISLPLGPLPLRIPYADITEVRRISFGESLTPRMLVCARYGILGLGRSGPVVVRLREDGGPRIRFLPPRRTFLVFPDDPDGFVSAVRRRLPDGR